MFYQGFLLPAAPYRGQTSAWCQREKQENLPGQRTTYLVQLSVPFVTSQGADFQNSVAVQALTFWNVGPAKGTFNHRRLVHVCSSGSAPVHHHHLHLQPRFPHREPGEWAGVHRPQLRQGTLIKSRRGHVENT